MKRKNTIKEAKFRFLIYQKNDKFIGICRETGYVEEGKIAKEVFERLCNGTKAIMEAVKKDENLLPSINQKPSMKYRFLFVWIPFSYSLKNFISSIPKEMELINRTATELNNDACACSA